MAKVELSQTLALTPEQAWEHVSRLNELGDWLVLHEGWRGDVPDDLTVGTQLVGVAGVKGMRNRVTWTVQESDPPHLIALTGSGVGGTKFGLRMGVQPSGKGSEFTVKIELGGRPLFGPIGSAAARAVKGDIERSVRRFAELYG